MIRAVGGKEEVMATTCPTCATPLDEAGGCVTCAAVAEGLALLARSGFAQVREMMTLLEEQGLGPEMEQVPATTKEERHHPKWNLYIPKGEVEAATTFLRRDWAALLGGGDAAAAAARGAAAVDLDTGGEIACPACGHRFTISAAAPDCPECGLSLGAGGDSVPGEGQDERAS
jgi:uncharacterized Zn finger protein (UPF0148 family)